MTGSYPYEEVSSDEVEKLYDVQRFPDVSSVVCGAMVMQCWRRQCHAQRNPHLCGSDISSLSVLKSLSTAHFHFSDPEERLAGLTGDWFSSFNDTDSAEMALLASMYVSNRVMLTRTVTASFSFSARKIWFGAGMLVPLPLKTHCGYGGG
ncbi:hypothetical protein N7489_007172 [Penicillium chrysogenum]|uniref:uncharacterized protein n=1 Tax=Penicillium chrysogenum TaxID=5076 RepID=UPI0024DF108D|nr:uncharacterized protein N7489_007172 [Penicillium chrysogenum]KAJ5237081.1 hypothetical protein N7489_007172 [Penicillium chrysogenum]